MKKENKEFKFKCGDFVKHKTGMIGYMLITSRGSFTDINECTDNMYTVSYEHYGDVKRMFLTEEEIELYIPKK